MNNFFQYHLIDFINSSIHAINNTMYGNTIIIFAGYPYQSRLANGYYQRVLEIDKLFQNYSRIYIDRNYSNEQSSWLTHPDQKSIVIGYYGNPIKKAFIFVLLIILVSFSRHIFIHSALMVKEAKAFLKIPFVKLYFDVHGVVPEEFAYTGRESQKKIYDEYEKIAISKAYRIIVVTSVMKSHLISKYPELKLDDKFIELPIFNSLSSRKINRNCESDKPVIIYAGGVQKWQQVHKIVRLIKKTSNNYKYLICTPNVELFAKLITKENIEKYQIEICHVSYDKLLEIYSKCDYGILLRKDNIVNNVACPTKLIEYLTFGIIPIVDSEKIGDFKELGMKSIYYKELYSNPPRSSKEIEQMIQSNYRVYEKLRKIQICGKLQLIRSIFEEK